MSLKHMLILRGGENVYLFIYLHIKEYLPTYSFHIRLRINFSSSPCRKLGRLARQD